MNNKRNNRYKSRGSILVITALAAIVWIFIAQSLFIVGAGGFGMIKSSRVALQAQQYAEIEVDRLKNVAYENLDSNGAHSRQAIANIQESGWEDEVSIGSEHAISGSDDAKQRIATINVYKSGDTLPRFTLELPLSSQNSIEENLEISIERGSINDILYFTPHWSLYSPSSGVSAWPVSDGKVSISYQHEEKIGYYLNSSIGKFSLAPAFPSHDVFKTVIVGGGLSKGTNYVSQTDVKKYVEDHLDEFKEKAYTLIPESRKATKFVVNDPSINHD